MPKEQVFKYLDYLILFFLSLQVFSVSFSVAVSSISFGIWGGLWIIELLLSRKLYLSKLSELKLFSFFVALYMVAEILSRLFAVIPENSFTGIKRVLLFLVFYVSILKFTDKKTLYRVFYTGIFIFSAVSIYEIINYIINYRPADIEHSRLSSFTYVITTSEIKMLIFLSAFPIIFAKENTIRFRIIMTAVLIPIFVSIYLTQTRNVFVSIFICIIIFGIVHNKKIILIFILLLALLYLIIPQSYKTRISSIFDPDYGSNKSRIVMWSIGLEMFKDRPLFGTGDNEFMELYEKYKKPEMHGEGSHLHSNYLMILATMGILGFISYAGMFAVLFLRQLKIYSSTKESKDRMFILGVILSFFAFHISGIFEWNFADHEVMTLFLFLMAVPFIIYNYCLNNK
ncbi:MAG: O-antigen ligase family protein [Ignavibacteria bacterium]|nr:O-antigen ligase family protein [Ignavibacteria bacterium]